MARNLANVEILTDTFNAWMLRTNEVIDVLRTEVLTANSTLGITGTSGAPRNARLWGAFTANNLNADALALGSNFVANSSAVLFGPVRVIAGGSNGTVGQVLTSTGTGVQWATAPGTGTVTNIASGNGVSFVGGATANTITTTGTITIRANTGIVVNSGGVSVNTAYLDTVVNPQTLLSYNWASPAAIGTGTANTGKFTTVTANDGPSGGYRIGTTGFKITDTEFYTPGFIEGSTPSSGGGIRVRTNGDGIAVISITSEAGSGSELNSFRHAANGELTYSNNFIVGGTARFVNGVEIGYKTIPQIITNINATIDPTQSSGAHHYKTTTSAIDIVFPTHASAPCANGTAITFINDATSGSILLSPATGAVLLQLGGTTSSGIRTIVPGGVATALKVATNKWIVSGTGVV